MDFEIKVPRNLKKFAHDEYDDFGELIPKNDAKHHEFARVNKEAMKALALHWVKPETLLFVSEKDLTSREPRYLIPAAPHDLVLPAIRYTVKEKKSTKPKGSNEPEPISEIIIAPVVLNYSKLENMKSGRRPAHLCSHWLWDWAFGELPTDEKCEKFLYEADECLDYGGVFNDLWHRTLIKVTDCKKRITNQPGKEKSPTSYKWVNVFMEIEWPRWEKKRLKQSGRADEIAASGLYPKLTVDGYRHICKVTGFLK